MHRFLLLVALMSASAYAGLIFQNPFPNVTYGAAFITSLENDGINNGIYYGDLSGKIFYVDNNTVGAPLLFANLSGITYGTAEGGLLDFAFHPDYENNGFVFTFRQVKTDDVESVVISRFIADVDAQTVDIATELQLFSLPYENIGTAVLGGQIAFDNNGLFYIGMGDYYADATPNSGIYLGLAQNNSSPWGKILRVDVDTNSTIGSVQKYYSIPSDNPYPNGDVPEIYASGVRQPWRFSFDSANRLWLGEVGADHYEEIILVQKGSNYGWRITEGTICADGAASCNQTGLSGPYYEYFHTQFAANSTDGIIGNCTIGGFVYEGSQVGAFDNNDGHYVFGDFTTGAIHVITFDKTSSAFKNVTNIFPPGTLPTMSTFGQDSVGELYVANFAPIPNIGRINKIAWEAEPVVTTGEPSSAITLVASIMVSLIAMMF